MSAVGDSVLRSIALARPDATRELEAPMAELLASLRLEVNSARALKKLGLSRRKVDRFLARAHRISAYWGLKKGTIKQEKDGSVTWVGCLDTENAWWGLSVAKYQVYSSGQNSVDAAWIGEQEDGCTAYRLFLLGAHLEDFVLFQREESRAAALELVEWFYPAGEPEVVAVTLSGPEWLDERRWLPEGKHVTPARARWLRHHLHNTVLGGETIEVHCEPPIRPGKKKPYRESEKTRRMRLFSRWYEGIQTDDEGLFSATAEALADEMVQGLSGVVLDGTCGVGALAIAAAKLPDVTKVIAVDIHERRLQMAAHNARIYGVEDRISFVVGRCEDQLALIEHDVLILDPPWGGRKYDREMVRICDVTLDLKQILASETGAVRMKLPRSFALSELPGVWTPNVAVDERGIIKFLVLERGPLSE